MPLELATIREILKATPIASTNLLAFLETPLLAKTLTMGATGIFKGAIDRCVHRNSAKANEIKLAILYFIVSRKLYPNILENSLLCKKFIDLCKEIGPRINEPIKDRAKFTSLLISATNCGNAVAIIFLQVQGVDLRLWVVPETGEIEPKSIKVAANYACKHKFASSVDYVAHNLLVEGFSQAERTAYNSLVAQMNLSMRTRMLSARPFGFAPAGASPIVTADPSRAYVGRSEPDVKDEDGFLVLAPPCEDGDEFAELSATELAEAKKARPQSFSYRS